MRRIAGVIAVSSAMITTALFELVANQQLGGAPTFFVGLGGAPTFFAGVIGFVLNFAICVYGDD